MILLDWLGRKYFQLMRRPTLLKKRTIRLKMSRRENPAKEQSSG
jgi:hypothetical protein